MVVIMLLASSKVYGCSLEYNPQAGPTKFMIGTEQGNIMTCNRKAKNPQDRVGASFPGLHIPTVLLVPACIPAHVSAGCGVACLAGIKLSLF